MSAKCVAWLALLAALLAGNATAEEANCAGDPNALGVSRILEVDPTGGPRYGTYQYPSSLDLFAGEVVLTFDDGPNPKTTPTVLDALDKHCVKATFFEVGKRVDAHPELTKEVADRGHTIGNHSYSHPRNLGHLSPAKAEADIERGFVALNAASGGRAAPFFRYPGLNNSTALNNYLAGRNDAIVSCDIGTDDWRRIGAEQIKKRTLARLEQRGVALSSFTTPSPQPLKRCPISDELKKRGYRVVHIVPKPPETLPAESAAHQAASPN